MVASLDQLKSFNLSSATVTVWVFKRSGGAQGQPPIYTGRWIGITADLEGAIKQAVDRARAKITETHQYALLAQNNENSALTISSDETYASLILDQAADATPGKRVKKLKDMANATLYVLKFVHKEQVFYAVRKTDVSWRSKASKSLLTVVYQNENLDLDDSPRFSLSRYVDFFIVGSEILVTEKARFESALNYKQAHISDFSDLRKEKEFKGIFTSLDALLEFVGENKIQLRRMSAIKQKGHYKNADFMKRLRKECAGMGLHIAFDPEGKIIPSLETCRDIFQALLDHRLDSRLTERLYDVENTSEVP